MDDEYKGQAQGGGTNTITLDIEASDIEDNYKDYYIEFYSGRGAGENRKRIIKYDDETKIATVAIPPFDKGIAICINI